MKRKSNQYYALIVDIVDSRKYKDEQREALQHLFFKSTKFLNQLFAKGTASPVSFSGGDEMQGLFSNPVTAFLYYRFLSLLLRPNTIRGGIGSGTWSVRFKESQESAAQVGTAYYCARDAINEAEANRFYSVVFFSEGKIDGFPTVLFDHSMSICKMRTARQTDAALAVEFAAPLTLEGINEGGSIELQRELLSEIMELRKASSMKDIGNSDLLEKTVDALGLDGAVFNPSKAISSSLPIDRAMHCVQKDISGISYELSRHSAMARQGIDRLLSESCIIQERNAVVALYYYLNATF